MKFTYSILIPTSGKFQDQRINDRYSRNLGLCTALLCRSHWCTFDLPCPSESQQSSSFHEHSLLGEACAFYGYLPTKTSLSFSLCLFPFLSSPPFCSSFDVCVCLFAQTYLHSWVHFIYTIGQLISFTRNNILKLFFYFCKLCYFIQVIYKMQDSITLNEYT